MKNFGSSLFLGLFGLPFACVAIFATYMISASIWEWQSAKSWIETEAQLKEVSLKTSRGSEGGSTYCLKGSYSYTFDTQKFTSDQMTFWSMTDNVGKFHQKYYKKLKGRSSAICYVNPDNPEESVIVRELRIEMIGFFSLFLIMFGGFGFSMVGYAIYSLFKAKKMTQSSNGDFIDSYSSKGIIFFFAIPAIFFTPLSILILPEIFSQVKNGGSSAFFGMLLPIVAVLSASGTVYFSMRHLRFGSSTICITGGQGTLGGKLTGYIVNSCSPINGFDVTIECSKTVRHGKNSQTQKLYTFDTNIKETDMTPNGRYRTDFDIPLPYNLPDSDEEKVTWKIKFKADAPGPDYGSSFEIPVRKSDESDSSVTKESILKESEITEAHPSIVKERILTHRAGNTLHIYFPMFRRIGGIVFSIIFLVIWTAITVVLIYKGVWLFAFFWGLTDLIMLFSILHMMFVSKKIIVAPEGLVFKKGFFGGGKEIHLEAHEVEEILVPDSNQKGMNYLKIKATEITINVEKQFNNIETPTALKILIENILKKKSASS